MAAQVTVDIRMQTPDHRLLWAAETHATLHIVAADVRAVLNLDGNALDELGAAVADARGGLVSR